jgi:hypothetical protein
VRYPVDEGYYYYDDAELVFLRRPGNNACTCWEIAD